MTRASFGGKYGSTVCETDPGRERPRGRANSPGERSNEHGNLRGNLIEWHWNGKVEAVLREKICVL